MAYMWFGTRSNMQWVNCPAVNIDASKQAWNAQTNYLNGGAYVRASVNAHKEYSLAWNLTSRAEVRKITDYADGLYGQEPVYWADPFTMDTNMMPQGWASPFISAQDGIILDGTTVRPALVSTNPNNLGYPTKSAQYTLATGTVRPTVWIPIPPGYVAWVGAHGTPISTTGGQAPTVSVQPTTGPGTAGTAVYPALLATTDSTRVNASFSSANNYDGILVSLGGNGVFALSGIIVQLLPIGVVPATGGFISGQGHSGCSFASQPVLTQYSAVMDKVGLTAKLIETNQWL